MQSYRLPLMYLTVIVLGINLVACSSVQQMIKGTPTSTPTSTTTPSRTPTLTSTPTSTNTPRPTITPKATSTKFAERKDFMFADIRKYYEAGYLGSTEGEYVELPDFEQSLAQIANYQWQQFDLLASTFVLSAHFKWSSAIEHSNLAGCGFVFSGDENYTTSIFLSRKNVVLLSYRGYKISKTSGSGSVHFGNSDEADFTLIVDSNLHEISVLVNNEFNVGYHLPDWESFRGYIGYAVISGTNTGYGTRCEVTNARLWKISDD